MVDNQQHAKKEIKGWSDPREPQNESCAKITNKFCVVVRIVEPKDILEKEFPKTRKYRLSALPPASHSADDNRQDGPTGGRSYQLAHDGADVAETP
jgi:hypothetical protein